jgi:Arc/MetJ-type ribon-helix-helix transcriptional regulator
MEVPLDSELEKIVLRKVETGEYPSISVLVEEALFLLMERDWARSQEELQEKVPGVFESGPRAAEEVDRP